MPEHLWETKSASLKELAFLFLKLGSTAFGGPAAHIALMEDEVVRRRGWLSHEQFLDLLGATNLIPGPNSTEMAIHIGRLRAGWVGLIVAGTCFILPAALIVTASAWVYVQFGSLPQVAGLLYGVKPVIIAVIVQALWGLTRTAVKTPFLAIVTLIALVAGLLGCDEILILFGAGGIALLRRTCFLPGNASPLLLSSYLAPMLSVSAPTITTSVGTSIVTTCGLWPLFLIFLKIGSVLYGSGYVLLAFLRADLVERWQWLTETQLLDAVAIGQFTPGPVFTTATFIGYLLAGIWGAIVATVGIFLPAFFFVAVSSPLIPLLRQSSLAGAFLDGVNVASLALMVVVTWQLGRVAFIDFTTLGLAAVSTIFLFFFRMNSAWLVLGGALVGLLLGTSY
jgi:chromate transporter